MTDSSRIERRRGRSLAFRVGQPAFIQIPKKVAAPLFVATSFLVWAVNQQTGSAIWFGPVYLLICAFSAWFVGNRFAVTLGSSMLLVHILDWHAMVFSGEPQWLGINAAIRICSSLAIVLMLGVAREALEIEWKFARIDPLTGALSRKAFFEAAEANASQIGHSVLIYADLNGLKVLNDGLGHERGDDALRNFANRVRSVIRKEDLFARMGGDEFVILLNVRDGAAAKVVAERLNKTINRESDEDQAALTCSLGVLILPAGSTAIDAELKLADTLMYHAKREQAGLVMGWSVKGAVERIISYAPDTDLSGQQRSAVRSIMRQSTSSSGEGILQKPEAA